MRSVLSFLLAAPVLVVATVVTGCSADAEATQGDEQNVTAAIGELNGFCGGIGGFQCKSGLRCQLQGSFPDAGGKCVADGPITPPPATCLAIPVCGGDEEQLPGSECPKDLGDSCRTQSMCGRTIACKSSLVTVEGELASMFAIGGETTGTMLKTKDALHELVLDAKERSSFEDGRFARATGKKVTLTGVETGQRTALEVSDFVVCPAPGTTLNCMPPVSPGNDTCGANRSWIASKCAGVQYVD